MSYELSFGTAPQRARRVEARRFRIAVLGDFSGRAGRCEPQVGEALAARKPQRIDIDNLEDVVERLGIELRLPIGPGGSVVKLRVRSLDDLHPDELYESLDLFSELAGLRARLSHSGTFAAAAEEVRGWADVEPPAPETSGGSVLRVDATLGEFAELLGGPPRPDPVEAAVRDLVRQAVGPHIVPEAHPDQAALVAAVDEALGTAMRGVLHHPDFQALESNLRALDFLVRRVETDESVELVLHDIGAEELAADLAAHDELGQSGLHRLLVQHPAVDAKGPYSAVAGLYQFARTPPHAELLGRLAGVMGAGGIPFIAGIDKGLLDDEPHELTAAAWSALRDLPDSAYLCLVCPRFLLRLPYGRKTEAIDSFGFEEFTPLVGLRSMLWGNGAAVAACLLGGNAARHGAEITPDAHLGLGEMPYFVCTDPDGDPVALPCAERLLTEPMQQLAKQAGACPLLAIKGRDEVRLAGFVSVAGTALAGPWGSTPAAGGGPGPRVSIGGDHETLVAMLSKLGNRDQRPATGDVDPELKDLLRDAR